ncbi:uncharacterized protein LOC113309041 isoform X2 [Papaver somniferum]|nr:uncharacterized protein LOC113309041 isoform X2 [Papaver somniferum]
MTKNHLIRIKKDKCRCPCKQCLNGNDPVSLDLVKNHLLKYGMAVSYRYTIWYDHGEEDNPAQDQSASSSVNVHNDETTFIGNENEAILEMLRENVESLTSDGKDGGEKTSEADLAIFSALLDEAKQELYPGCKDFTSLTFLVRLMHIKVLNRLSNKSFEMHLELLKKAFPKNNNIPSSYYEAKRMLKGLGLGYESIHACKNDCALFWKEYEKEDKYPVCSEYRYKFNDGKGKKIPHKVLRYFPLQPRLQRLFSSKHTARDMRWHKGRHVEDGVFRNPADAEAWKDFDARYPWFAAEPRNVRLGLATDGFNPFGNMSNAYSLWPVVLMSYNLPPFKCMKQPFFMMSLLIPGPQAPGNDIDVYLRPLIDELKELWDVGVETRDVSTGKVFCMHAAVLWTINDFPAYANLSGWSTKGYLACPMCNDDPPSRKLRSKIGYLCHRRFLNPGHTWRDSRLHDGHKEKRDPPEEKTGEQLLQQMQNLGINSFGKHPSYSTKKRKRSKEELSWTKKSIFYELPYWKHLKIRHNIDVMHVEKNICDNIVGTMLGIDGKNKDTEKARLDLEDMNIRKELHLRPKGDKFENPPACYTLKPEQRRDFCKFLRSVKFPDGYAANISRCANIADGKIHGLKSHDCHILLQRLLPVGIRAYLRKDVCTAIIDLCNFFHDLCAKTLTMSHLDKLEKDIVLILCKLERIFPPAFFDVMVHLAVHFPRESKLVGPVGCIQSKGT